MNRFVRYALLLLSLWMAQAVASTTTVTYFHNDPAGNPVVETDAGGKVVWQESYYPYGGRTVNAAASTDNHLWFASAPYDSTAGLSYMGARYYDPVTGRFFSMDPAQSDPAQVHEFNRYAYANNNPLAFVDTSGRTPIDIAFIVFDTYKLGRAIYAGSGALSAAGGLGLDAIGIISPVPGAGPALKALRATEAGVDAARAGGEIAGAAKAAEVGFSAAKSAETAEATAKEGGEAYSRYRAGANFSKKTKSDIAERAGNKCEYCGVDTVAAKKSQRGVTPPRNEAQTDHIVPRSEGGTNAPSNAAHACRGCNRDMSNMAKPSPRQE